MKNLLLVLILIVIGCNNTTGPQSTELTIEQYYPLNIGNTWTYEYYVEPWEGIMRTVSITNSYSWGNTIVYCIDDGYFTIAAGVLKEWHDNAPSDSSEWWALLQEPLEVGHKWLWTNIPVYEDTLIIVSLNETIGVPAGLFENCIKVITKSNSRYFIYAPDVGLVKSDLMELIEYEVK
jgi:hypothetical protein